MSGRILGVIPARGGSKGVPGKNIKPLGGLPLIAHTILLARESGALDRLWVSTDDPGIAEAAARFGAKPAWPRPPELAQDGSSMAEVLKHLLARLARDEGYRPDAVMILQPTSPFRRVETIRRAVELHRSSGGKTVVSVTESRAHPYWSYRVDEAGRLRPFIQGLGKPAPRQQLPPAFVLDGSMHLIATDLFLKTGSFYNEDDLALPVPAEEAVDIDTPYDWEIAEALWDLRHPPDAPAERVYLIAEAGVNHDGKLEDALALVDAAKDAGADAVKFQTFRAGRLVARGAAKAAYQERTAPGAKDQADLLAPLELDADAHLALRERCRARGIDFLSTPFDEASVDLLERVGVPLYKLSSGDLTHRPLIERVAATGKPLILSTGMSDLGEVAEAVGWFRAKSAAPLTLLHCVTEYPAPPEQSNLRAMDALRRAFRLPAGFSDHAPGVEVSVAAAARGAAVIEKHLTLDKRRPGPDHAASLEPAEFAALARAIRSVSSALGDGVKRPAPCETGNRAVARRSLVTTRALTAGETLARADLDCKRPGRGIPPAALEEVVGRALKRPVAADTTLAWEDLA